MQISDSDISKLNGDNPSPTPVVEKTPSALEKAFPVHKLKAVVGIGKEKSETIEDTDISDFLNKYGNSIINRFIDTWEAEQKRRFVAFTFKLLLSFALLIIIYLIGTKGIIPVEILSVLIGVLIGFIFGSYRS